MKMNNNQLSIKLGQFTQEELDVVLGKFKNRKAAVFDKIASEVWETEKFDDLLLWYSTINMDKMLHPPFSPRKVTSKLPRTNEL